MPRLVGNCLQQPTQLPDAAVATFIKQYRDKTRASASRNHYRISIMLYTIAVVLLILWVLGLVTSFTAGGLLHLLLVVAVVMVIFQLISGRKVG